MNTLKQDMAKVLDENGELERRLSIIIGTATGEQEYVPADGESRTQEEETAAIPVPNDWKENEMETTVPSLLQVNAENETDSRNNKMQTDATFSSNTGSSSLTASQESITLEQENEQEELSVASKADYDGYEGTGVAAVNLEKKQSSSYLNVWTDEEMMALYRLRDAIGINDWTNDCKDGKDSKQKC